MVTEVTTAVSSDSEMSPNELPFDDITKAHILNCAFPSWHSKYRTITPKSRILPLPREFVEYLRADGILIPEDDEPQRRWSDDDSGIFSASDATDTNDGYDDDSDEEDVAAEWRPTHNAIKEIISELGGCIVPKLNWSSPKDATWMNANSMECRQPSEIYLLLKSSDFITHDLEHAFDGCIDSPECSMSQADIPYYLVLRKYVQFNPSVEFRCFVRRRKLLGICQRDLNHFDFLFNMKEQLQSLIQEFFDVRLRDTFPDDNFVFDVYVPAPHKRVWLIDINPWAPRTDPLLFSWLELLTMDEPPDESTDTNSIRLSMKGMTVDGPRVQSDVPNDSLSESDSDVDEEFWRPELRLIKKSDPEAYSFSTPQYSAHKLPRDVVDASQSGEGLREFAREWQDILAKRQKEEEAESSDGE